jgi:hypothetical protein
MAAAWAMKTGLTTGSPAAWSVRSAPWWSRSRPHSSREHVDKRDLFLSLEFFKIQRESHQLPKKKRQKVARKSIKINA